MVLCQFVNKYLSGKLADQSLSGAITDLPVNFAGTAHVQAKARSGAGELGTFLTALFRTTRGSGFPDA